MRFFLKWAVRVLGVVVVVAVAGIVWLSNSFNEALETKVNPDLYSDIVATRTASSPKYSFLPKFIDPKAEAIGFYYVPGFLQGGDVVCLRLRLPEEKVAIIINELEASGRKEVEGFGDVPTPQSYPRFNITPSQRDNLFDGDGKLPSDFRIFLFESDLEDIQKNWNHNFLAFTAVSLDKREVVYYANEW